MFLHLHFQHIHQVYQWQILGSNKTKAIWQFPNKLCLFNHRHPKVTSQEKWKHTCSNIHGSVTHWGSLGWKEPCWVLNYMVPLCLTKGITKWQRNPKMTEITENRIRGTRNEHLLLILHVNCSYFAIFSIQNQPYFVPPTT